MAYQRSGTAAPSLLTARKSVVVTSGGVGCAAPALAMIASKVSRLVCTSPTGGGVVSAMASAIGARAAANSGSNAKLISYLLPWRVGFGRRVPRGQVGSGVGSQDDLAAELARLAQLVDAGYLGEREALAHVHPKLAGVHALHDGRQLTGVAANE